MSVWYHLNVTAIAADGAAVAKFFGLKNTWEEVRADTFEFSFGGKNAPGLTFRKIVEQNPDLIFLVEQQIECDTRQWFLMRWDQTTNTQVVVFVQDSGEWNNEINKKIWEDFKKANPSVPPDNWMFQKGHEKQRWQMFFIDFNRSALILSQAAQYQDMIPFHCESNLEFDNQPLEQHD